MSQSKTENPFHVPLGIRAFSHLLWRLRHVFLSLEKLETGVFRRRLQKIEVDRPLYVSGLARSGSTVLLEFLSSLPGTGSHLYLDYPALYTPLFWNRLIEFVSLDRGPLCERPHKDGILINLDSPESMEEIIWRTFFPSAHDSSRSNVLDDSVVHPRFEKFYQRHLRKILLLRGATRYLSKANYNASRIPYLLKIFPDARFVVPVRSVHSQVASYIRLNAYVSSLQQRFPSVLSHFRRACHFEFGLDMRPINTVGNGGVDDILELFRTGQETRAWARYWSRLYRYLYDLIQSDVRARDACLVVRFEDLCRDPRPQLERVVTHCQLDAPAHEVMAFASRLREPTYYKTTLSSEQNAIVEEEAVGTMRLYGYVGR
ncbi:MAG: sulfotransferase [Myxococcota bacterium]|nr:sulfotransferase [Myxococcota bacterium]